MRGLGRTTVYGRKRVPLPPASTTARLDIVDALFIAAQIAFVAEPLDRQGEPRIERRHGRKAGCLFQLRTVAAQSSDLAARRTNAGWVRYGSRLDIHHAGNPGKQVAHRNLVPGANMKNFALASFHPADGRHAGARVSDESKVPCSGEVA